MHSGIVSTAPHYHAGPITFVKEGYFDEAMQCNCIADARKVAVREAGERGVPGLAERAPDVGCKASHRLGIDVRHREIERFSADCSRGSDK